MSLIHEQIPTEIRSGDDVKWYHTDPDFSPDEGHTLVYRLMTSAGSVEVTATDNSDGRWLCHLASADNDLAEGVATWVAIVTDPDPDPDEVYTVSNGVLTVLPDLSAAATHDGRTHVKKVLDALEARIEARASQDQLELSVGDKAIKLMTIGEVVKARQLYQQLWKQELDAQKLTQGINPKSTVRVRFV